MAENDNVLGISGQMDISDIQSTIDKLCSTLQRVGVETDALSERMTKALNDIAKSDGDISTKTQQAMSILKEAMDEAKKGMEDVPSMIKVAQQHVDDYQSSISKLNAELANTPQSSSTYGEITKQLEAQQTALKLAQEDVNDLTQAYSNASDVMGKANSVYEALNTATITSSATGQAQAVTNVEVGASATAAATATGAEAAAHVSNAAAAAANAQAENANVEATKNLTSSLQEYISVASGRAEIERMQSENSKELRNDIKMYEQSIKDIQATLDSTDFSKKISDATAAIEKQQAKIDAYKESLANLSPEEDATGQGTNYYNSLIEQAQQKIADLQSQIEGWQQQQQTLNADLQEYNTLLDAAKQIQSGETIIPTEPQEQKFSVDVDSTSLQDLRTQLDDSKSKLQDLEAEADKFNDKTLGDTQKQKLADLNKEIDDTKEKIQVLQDAIKQKNEETFVGSLRNHLSELKEKVSEFGSELKDKVTAPFTELGDKISNSGFGQRFTAEFSQVKAGMEDFKNGAVNVITANGKLQENVGNLTKAIGGLGIPLGGALTGIKAVTKALWGMCATPIGAVIAVIVLGLKAVHTWMTKSANGQRVMAKLSAYLGSLMSSLTDIVVTLGEYIYHCFADNNAPLRDFGNNLVTTFKTAIKAVLGIVSGLGTTLKGILTFDWDTFSNGVKKTWEGLKGVGDTVISAFKTQVSLVTGAAKFLYDAATNDKLHAQLSQELNSMFSNASKAANLAERQLNTEIAIKNEKLNQLELDKKIAAKREDIYRLSGKERINAIEEAKALEYQKYDGILKLQRDQLSIQQQQMKLHTVSMEDLGKERELRAGILRTEAQRAASTRMLTRQEEAAKRSMASQAKSAEKAAAAEAKREFKQNEATKSAQGKYDETLYNNDKAREKAITDLETKVADARIAAMKEGFTKTQAERKREQEKELKDLQVAEENAIDAERKRQKAEFDARNAIRKAQGKSTLVWNDDTDFQETDDVKSIRQMYATLQQLTVNRQIEDEKKAADQLIQAHQSYRDKLISIDKKYQEDIQAIDAAIAEAQKRGDTAQVEALERTRDKRTAEHGKEKLQASFDELKNSPEYVAAFTDIDKASTETLNNLVSRFEKVKEAAASSLNPQDAKTYFDTINGLVDELISRDPVGMAKRLSDQLQQQRQDLEQAQLILQAVQNGANVPILGQWKVEKNDDGTLKLIPTYYTLEQAQENVAKSGQAVAHTEAEIEKASKKVLSQISSLISAFTSLGNAIGGTAGNIINLIGDFANFTISTVNAVKSIDQNAKGLTKTLQQLQAGLTIASAFVGLASKVSSFFKTSDDYYQKYAKKQAAINSLRDSVNEYRLSVIKAQQAEKNWFATTGLQNLKDSWKQHTQVIKEYSDKLLEPQEIYKNKGAGLSKLAIPAIAAGAVVAGVFTAGIGSAAIGALAGTLGGSLAATAAVAGASAAVGWIAGSGSQSGMDSITYKKGQTAAINNLRIQTRHRTAFRSEKTADLRDWVKQNYGEDLFSQDQETGMLLINADLAQKVVDEKGGKLKGQTKDTLEKLIELRKEYDKFEDDLKDYVSQTYSPIVDDMSDAVWSWLSEGKDALQQFKDSASKTFSDIGKEMIKQMLLKDVFGTFQDDLYKLYKQYAAGGISLDQLTEQMGEIMGMTVGKFDDNLPSLEKFAEQYRDIMAKFGFDVTGNTEQSATSKGVTSITYDQANLLVNLATARNIALEKGNEVRQEMLNALNAKGYISDYPTPATPVMNNITTSAPSVVVPDVWKSATIDTDKIQEVVRETLRGSKDIDTTESILSLQQAMSIDMSQLRISTTQIQSDISVMRDIQEQGLNQLTRIEQNTRPISGMADDISDIKRMVKDNS